MNKQVRIIKKQEVKKTKEARKQDCIARATWESYKGVFTFGKVKHRRKTAWHGLAGQKRRVQRRAAIQLMLSTYDREMLNAGRYIEWRAFNRI